MSRYTKEPKIVKFSEYCGYLATPQGYQEGELCGVVDKEEFKSLYFEQFDKENTLSTVEAIECETAFHVNLKTIITELADDNGYEEMSEQIDLGSDLLKEAQKLIDKWEEENSQALTNYYWSNKVLVDLTELNEEYLKKENIEDGF